MGKLKCLASGFLSLDRSFDRCHAEPGDEGKNLQGRKRELEAYGYTGQESISRVASVGVGVFWLDRRENF